MEADTKFGGLKLYNLELFDSSSKIGWLKKYIRSSARWCSVPDDFELHNLFRFGTDFIDRIYEMTFNPFWKDVLGSVKLLGKKDDFMYGDNIIETPLWHNPDLKLQIKREWVETGIYCLWDVLDRIRQPYTKIDFDKKFNLKTNFLEYGSFCIIIRENDSNEHMLIYWEISSQLWNMKDGSETLVLMNMILILKQNCWES